MNGLSEWIRTLAFSIADPALLLYGRILIATLSFLSLFEFARRTSRLQNQRIPGPWLPTFLLGMTAIGSYGNVEVFSITTQYMLAIPASLWTTAIFWSRSHRTENGRCALAFTSGGFLLYTLSCWITSPAPFFPASVLNTDTFLSVTGFPLTLFQALATLWTTTALWLFSRTQDHARLTVPIKTLSGQWLITVLSVVLITGWVATGRIGHQRDLEQRENLLNLAQITAFAIQDELFQQRSRTSSEENKPQWDSIHRQFARIHELNPHMRWLYALSLRGDDIVFIADSTLSSSPNNTPPTTLYSEAPSALRDVFTTGKPLTTGPYKNRWGVFISAFAPIQDPTTGHVLAIVGFNIEAKEWQLMLAQARLPPILITMLISMLLAGFAFVYRRTYESNAIIAISENRYRTLIEGSPNFVTLLDREGRPVTINENGLRAMNLLEKEAIGMRFTELWPASSQPEIQSGLERAFAGHRTHLTASFSKPDGEQILWNVHFTPVVSDDRQVRSLVVIMVDITERKIAEQELRRSLQLMETFMENIPIPIFQKDLNGIYCGCNTAFETFFGATRQTIIGGQLQNLISGDQVEVHRKIDADLLARGGRIVYESRLLFADGDVRDTIVHKATYLGADGTPSGIVGALMDVTHQKRVENLLRQQLQLAIHLGSTRDMKSMLDSILQMLVQIDGVDCGGIYLRDDHTDSLDLVAHRGLPEEFIRQVRRFDASSPQTQLAREGKLVYITAKDQILKSLFPWDKGNTSFLAKGPRSVVVVPVCQEGKLLAVLNAGTQKLDEIPVDIQNILTSLAAQVGSALTRIRAEEALQESEDRFRRLAQTTPEAIITFDGHGMVELWNPGAESIFGYSALEMLGHSIQTVIPTHAHQQHDLVFGHMRQSDRSFVLRRMLEVQGRRKDGSEFPAEISISTWSAKTGPHIAIICRDITERKRTATNLQNSYEMLRNRARELEKAQQIVLSMMEDTEESRKKLDITNRQLEEAIKRMSELAITAESANRAKGDFLANMSHEIRTPMNGIMGMAELLLNSPLNKDQKESAEVIVQSSRALLMILNDILDFSKIEAGKVELQSEPFDMREIIENVAQLFKVQAIEKGLELRKQFMPDHPWRVVGDGGRVRQILMNLVGNAVKFTDRGYVQIDAKCTTANQQSATFEMEVRDTGVGIPEKNHKLLFNEFSQADMSSTRRHEGTGLGLAISKRIAVMMGGTIGFTSREGEGSTFHFTVTLPLQQPDHQTKKIVELSTPRQSVKAHVLIVEDNLVNQKVARSILKKVGCTFETACNGREAVERVQAGAYDIVFMDCAMPEMDGYEATQQIRQWEATHRQPSKSGRHLPIVAMTARVSAEDQAHCLMAGMDNYMAKPLTILVVQSMIEKYCSLLMNVTDFEFHPPVVATNKDEKAILNTQQLLALGCDDPGLMFEVIHTFTNDIPQLIGQLLEGLQTRDASVIERVAHTIKGAALNVGGIRTAEIARDIERLAKERHIESCAEQMGRLQQAFAELADKLRHTNWNS